MKRNERVEYMESLGLKLNKVWRALEWVLSILGTVNCVWLANTIWRYQLSMPDIISNQIWPLPALFLIEIVLLSTAAMFVVIMNHGTKPIRGASLPWISAGALAVFIILAGFSFGTGLIPATGAFLGAGIFSDIRQEQGILKHIGFFMLAVFFQSLLMFAILLVQA